MKTNKSLSLIPVLLAILFLAALSIPEKAAAKIELSLGQEILLDTSTQYHALVFTPPETGFYKMTYTGSFVTRIQGNQQFVGAVSKEFPTAVYCRKGEVLEFEGKFSYGENASPTIKIDCWKSKDYHTIWKKEMHLPGHC